MATVVTLGAVTTGDAVPLVAPFRISMKATKNRATIPFNVAGSGLVRAWSIRFGATNVKVGGQGMVTGEALCGPSRSLARALGDISDDVDYTELPSSADGSYNMKVRAYTDDGWA